ncbi:MAG: signal recognition particle subunit SRP19/SEC65 family protein [Thermoplasmata archaeon]
MIIYPSYFSGKYSRKEGRKVPGNFSFDPNPEIIEKAIKVLGYKYEKQEKRYPKHWYNDRIRFYIETNEKKSEVLKKISKIIKNNFKNP